jgi:hypothetical protein
MDVKQVQRVLTSKLEEFHLVRRSDDGAWVAIDRDLDEVPEALGVELRPNYRTLAFQRDRQHRKLALDTLRRVSM